MSLLMSGVGSLLSFVVYGDEVKNVTGELRGKNASSAQVRFVRILFILSPPPKELCFCCFQSFLEDI